jgi:hypothetical protein
VVSCTQTTVGVSDTSLTLVQGKHLSCITTLFGAGRGCPARLPQHWILVTRSWHCLNAAVVSPKPHCVWSQLSALCMIKQPPWSIVESS